LTDIKISKLVKSFGSVKVLKSIDLEIKSGEFCVFVGPSGCGKTTLLRCIAGLADITSGRLEIGGRFMNHVAPASRGVAMVFQSYALYPHMTVFGNMAYSLKIKRMSKPDIRAKVEEVAKMLQLDEYMNRLPKELSGGQRQRVAIGRAIVRNPDVFLFDEPLSNLDAALRVQTRFEIAQLKKQLPESTMVYVTHDQTEAMTLADRIVVMKDGNIEQVGSPSDLYENPLSLFVAGFIGSPGMNFLPRRFSGDTQAHTIGVRPEHMDMHSGDHTGWPGKVLHYENLGADVYYYVDLGTGKPVVVRQSERSIVQSGQTVSLVPRAGRAYYFDASGQTIQTE